jgi:zinc transporter ZupT
VLTGIGAIIGSIIGYFIFNETVLAAVVTCILGWLMCIVLVCVLKYIQRKYENNH